MPLTKATQNVIAPITATGSTTARTLANRFADVVNVKDFGAVGDGVADDNSSVLLMIAAVGYVRFSKGNYLLNTASISVPIIFEYGAYITVPLGNTLTITNRIESPRQFIFQGAGNYSLGHSGSSGEDSRQVHASWFGAFPNATIGVDVGPNINKAFASMGNTRESVVEFDIGNYRVESPVNVTRGGFVKGQGSRRTVFNSSTDGFDLFTTIGEAVRFEGIQFEPNNPNTERSSAWIKISNNNCEIKDVFAGRAFRSFIIVGNNTLIRDIGSFFNIASSLGSSLIAIQSSNNQIYDVRMNTSTTFSQQFGIHIGADLGNPVTISGNIINGINSTSPSTLAFIDASISNISRTIIKNIIYNGSLGSIPDSAIKISSSSIYNIENTIITDVIINGHPSNGILFEQASSGTMFDITLDNITVSGNTGIGIGFTRTNGFIKDIRIGSGVDVKNRLTPISYIGSNITNIFIDPLAIKSVLPSYCYDFIIPDDSVAQINLMRSVFTGFLMVSVGNVEYLISVIRAASSPSVTAINASTNMNTDTIALTGTTGIDGKFTVGVTNGILYLENRLGFSSRVNASILTGVL
jgi:hypothetical protein